MGMLNFPHRAVGNDRKHCRQTDRRSGEAAAQVQAGLLGERLKAVAVDSVRLFQLPVLLEGFTQTNPAMSHVLRSPLGSRLVALCSLLGIAISQVAPVYATSWPTQWSFECLENESSEWRQSLRVQTVPGVLYHLQVSDSLEDTSWSDVEQLYGTGGEWIWPIMRGSERNSINSRFGHVGILDYDGAWINAGRYRVTKCLHLLDTEPFYKPNTFRNR